MRGADRPWSSVPLNPGTPESTMYIGPDSLMPVASAFAAIAGFLLMFWRRLIGAMRLLAQRVGAMFARR